MFSLKVMFKESLVKMLKINTKRLVEWEREDEMVSGITLSTRDRFRKVAKVNECLEGQRE